ncbi:MAG TPA: HAD hydrolase-like protein, partial [Candidatus Caenarcaniphilales bacterium]
MTLKAVLFDFNGVIIDDESIHQTLVEQILVSENLRPQPNTYQQFCLGRSDRACLKDLLSSRGRVVTEAYLEALVAHKAQSYQNYLNSQASLP